MTRAYNRGCRLTIWKPRPTPTTPLGAFFGAMTPNAAVIEALRVQFAIKKSTGSDPNTCSITVTNLAARTLAELQDRPRRLTLEIGYDGRLEQLFGGDVSFVNPPVAGPDRDTVIEVRDGGRAYASARVNRSYSAGTAMIVALREAAGALGLELPRTAEARPELQRQFAQGLVLAGRASDELSRLLSPLGLGWSIQDSTLQILGAGEVRAGQAIVVEKQSGMIGSPAFSPPSKPGAKPVLTVLSLLYPQVTPGGTIDVRSERVRGQFKVQAVQHNGDTFGECKTEIEAVSR